MQHCLIALPTDSKPDATDITWPAAFVPAVLPKNLPVQTAALRHAVPALLPCNASAAVVLPGLAELAGPQLFTTADSAVRRQSRGKQVPKTCTQQTTPNSLNQTRVEEQEAPGIHPDCQTH